MYLIQKRNSLYWYHAILHNLKIVDLVDNINGNVKDQDQKMDQKEKKMVLFCQGHQEEVDNDNPQYKTNIHQNGYLGGQLKSA